MGKAYPPEQLAERVFVNTMAGVTTVVAVIALFITWGW